MRSFLNIIVPIAICFIVGFIASWFQADATENWYPLLNKSPLTPPNSVFPIAWSILYICMGLSIGLILNSIREVSKVYFIRLFVLQLIFNFSWSILFFYLENPLLGMIDIVLLDLLIILYAVKAYPIFRISSLLFIPYIVWVTFASYLNLYILANNPLVL